MVAMMVARIIGILMVFAGFFGVVRAVIDSMSSTEHQAGLLGGGGLAFIFVGIILAVWG
jgi:hypothetical protein